jgi:hypothetical protein
MAGNVTREAHQQLRHLFGTRSAHGAAMAVQASIGVEAPETIAGSCAALANELLDIWESSVTR